MDDKTGQQPADAAGDPTPPPLGAWHATMLPDGNPGFRLDADGLACTGRMGAGFTSLALHGEPVWHESVAESGLRFRRGEQWLKPLPWFRIATGPGAVRRGAAAVDGVFSLNLSLRRDPGRFALYAGFNDHAGADLVIPLAPSVLAVRDADEAGPIASAPIAARADQPLTQPVDVAHPVLVLRHGASLAFDAPLRVAWITPPHAAAPCMALIAPCEGFAANAWTLTVTPPSIAARLAPPIVRIHGKGAGVNPGEPEPRVFAAGEAMHVSIEAKTIDGHPAPLHWTIDGEHSLGGSHFSIQRSIDASSPADETIALSRPGVTEVSLALADPSNDDAPRVIWTDGFRIVYDVEGYRPTYRAPGDLRAFWDQTLAELRAQPMDPIEREIQGEWGAFRLFSVELTGWRGARFWSLLFVPTDRDLPLPAMLATHPAATGGLVKPRADGVYGSEVKQHPGYVTLTPLVRGYPPGAEDVPFNHPWWGPLDSRDRYIARSWYCALVRATDWLLTRTDLIDPTRVVAHGGSQGGSTAIVTAALHEAVTHCIALCPADTMLHEIIDPGCYDAFGPTEGQVPDGDTLEQVKDRLAYYDPAHLAAWVTCPTWLASSSGDRTVHPMGTLGVYHALTRAERRTLLLAPGETHKVPDAALHPAQDVLDEVSGVSTPRKHSE